MGRAGNGGEGRGRVGDRVNPRNEVSRSSVCHGQNIVC